MNIFEALTLIKNSNIAVSPFANYEAATETERVETGAYFKSDKNAWPINEVAYSTQGNLNIKLVMTGKLYITEKMTYDAKEIRNVTIVKNGELKQTFLVVEKNKTAQAQLIAAGVPVKNNVIDLSHFNLTDTTSLSIETISEAAVNDYLHKLKTPKTVKAESQVPKSKLELMLETLGLKNGIYTAPVKKQTVVEANDKLAIKLAGLSSNTTKLAKKLKDANVTVKNVNLSKIKYDMRCLKMTGTKNISYSLSDGTTVTGTVTL